MLAQAAVAVSVPVDGALSDGDAAHPPVRIGMPLENPPYIYENPSDGLDVQVIRGVFDWADIKVVFVHAPLVRLPLLLDNGLVDGFISFSHVSTLSDGGRHYHQTRPYSYWRNAIRQTLSQDVELQTGLANLVCFCRDVRKAVAEEGVSIASHLQVLRTPLSKYYATRLKLYSG